MKNKEKNTLPEQFIDRLLNIIPSDKIDSVLNSFSQEKSTCIRVNEIKTSVQNVQNSFKENSIEYKKAPLAKINFILTQKDIRQNSYYKDLVENGIIYPQNISSTLPVILLDPKENETVLDMCAAPGSKTSQIAAMMKNKGIVYAVDAVRKRTYKLRSVLKLLGVENVRTFCCDGRRFRSPEIKSFDKILVDAPCSSEARFKTFNKKTQAYWSLRKIKETSKKQKGLLLSASRLLKSQGTLVYSTCSFSPEENEGVIDWFLKKSEDEFFINKIENYNIPSYACLKSWKKKVFSAQTQNCLRILPDGVFEGFFTAVIKRK